MTEKAWQLPKISRERKDNQRRQIQERASWSSREPMESSHNVRSLCLEFEFLWESHLKTEASDCYKHWCFHKSNNLHSLYLRKMRYKLGNRYKYKILSNSKRLLHAIGITEASWKFALCVIDSVMSRQSITNDLHNCALMCAPLKCMPRRNLQIQNFFTQTLQLLIFSRFWEVHIEILTRAMQVWKKHMQMQ